MAIKKHLGTKLAAAMAEKGVGPAEVARHFGVKQPSVQGWMKTGRILKSRIPALSAYFNKPLAWWLLSDVGVNHLAEQHESLYLSDAETDLVRLYRQLSKVNQAKLTERALTLLGEQPSARK